MQCGIVNITICDLKLVRKARKRVIDNATCGWELGLGIVSSLLVVERRSSRKEESPKIVRDASEQLVGWETDAIVKVKNPKIGLPRRCIAGVFSMVMSWSSTMTKPIQN